MLNIIFMSYIIPFSPDWQQLPCEIDLAKNVKSLENELNFISKTILANGGHANEDQIEAIENKGITVAVPFPKNKNILSEITFEYDDSQDIYRCSAGKKIIIGHKKPTFYPKFFDN